MPLSEPNVIDWCENPQEFFAAVARAVAQQDPVAAIAYGDPIAVIEVLVNDRAERMKTTRNAQCRGGAAPKRLLPGVWKRLREYVETHPRASVREAWESFPPADHRVEVEGLIYRDGDKLVEVDDNTGRDHAISRRSFERYLTLAKEQRSRSD